jgi:hypothetical protein
MVSVDSVSPGLALSNQLVGWCCIDRLSWQRLSGLIVLSNGPNHASGELAERTRGKVAKVTRGHHARHRIAR